MQSSRSCRTSAASDVANSSMICGRSASVTKFESSPAAATARSGSVRIHCRRRSAGLISACSTFPGSISPGGEGFDCRMPWAHNSIALRCTQRHGSASAASITGAVAAVRVAPNREAAVQRTTDRGSRVNSASLGSVAGIPSARVSMARSRTSGWGSWRAVSSIAARAAESILVVARRRSPVKRRSGSRERTAAVQPSREFGALGSRARSLSLSTFQSVVDGVEQAARQRGQSNSGPLANLSQPTGRGRLRGRSSFRTDVETI